MNENKSNHMVELEKYFIGKRVEIITGRNTGKKGTIISCQEMKDIMVEVRFDNGGTLISGLSEFKILDTEKVVAYLLPTEVILAASQA